MMRVRLPSWLATGAVAALVASGAATAAGPDVQQRIVPGQGIGKVRIGMSLNDVKGILGQPEAVIRRTRRGLARTFVEYSWSFTSWRVGFDVHRGRYAVVSVRSSVRRERTRDDVGYGSPATRVQRLYRTECRPAWTDLDDRDPTQGSGFLGYGCVSRGLFFIVAQLCGDGRPRWGARCGDEDSRWVVVEFGVLAKTEQPPFELGAFSVQYKPIQ